MADLQAYDAQGNPIAGVKTPLAYNASGLPIGSISESADERRRKLEAQTASTPNQPGAVQRFFQGMGIPTSKDEFVNLLKEGALNASTMGMYGGLYKPAMGISEDPSYTGINRAVNPMAAPMENFGEGNIAGGLGGTTLNLAAGIGGGIAAGKMGPKSVPSKGGKINLINPKQGGVNTSGVGTPQQPLRQPPAQVEPLLPVTMEPNARPLPVRALSALNKLVNPMQHAADAYRTLAGTEPPPNKQLVPYEVLPERPPTAIPGENLLLDNPFTNPSHGPLPTAESGLGSPPLRAGADWFQPITEASYGNAPAQNSAGKFLNSFPSDTAPLTFEAGNAGSTVTQGMTPPLGPAELQGINSQTSQMMQGAQILGEGAVAGFSPQQLQQLMQYLSQIPDK